MRKPETISKILRLKDNRKKELELKVKKVINSVDAEHSKLFALEKEFTDILSLFNKKNTEGSLNANDISSFYDYLSRINTKIKTQKKIHLQKLNELVSLQNIFVNALKDKKMFEILNDKAVKKESRDKTVLEQKDSDSLSLLRRLR